MANYCPRCGFAVSPEARFCSNCGFALLASTGAAEPPVGASVHVAKPVTDLPISPPAPAPPDPVAPIDAPSAPHPFSEPRPALPPLPEEAEQPMRLSPGYATATDTNENALMNAPVPQGTAWQAEPDASPLPQDTRSTRAWIIYGLPIAAVIIGIAAITLMGRLGGDSNPPESANTTSVALNTIAPTPELGQYYAVTIANIRDMPDTKGTTVIGKLARGQSVRGSPVAGLDNVSQWLKLEGEERYINLTNLSQIPMPELATTDGTTRIVGTACSLLSAPEASAAFKANAPAGKVVKLVGMTANGYAEIGLPEGGVGYVADGGAACGMLPASAKADTDLIRFDAHLCAIGGGIAAYISRARVASEGSTDRGRRVIPVGKQWRGLLITNVAFDNGRQTIFFDASPEKVINALAGSGDEEVEMGARTSLGPTDLADQSLGQSALSCAP